MFFVVVIFIITIVAVCVCMYLHDNELGFYSVIIDHRTVHEINDLL